ncbi:PIG-L family deacetylase [Pseudonocardia sp. GCM10023141]|uniref:PIG-L family deacetylase n=1 Tax=Pseudonocardia sp. GCM10023141 TaxID=3252653 RepID=UPI00360D597B
MSVLVCFHAHPDDEVFLTGGVMRLASDAGHRVVLVTATDGALGEFPDGLLDEGELLVDRRRSELEASAAALGVHRLEMLGYADSGMAGTPENARPEAFCNVDPAAAAGRLAKVLVEEGADVLTVYDPHGNYGHPDHVQVHVVGLLAADLAGITQVYEASVNRDRMMRLMKANPSWGDDATPEGVEEFGLPESEITTVVDVTSVMAAKTAAMRAHPRRSATSARSWRCPRRWWGRRSARSRSAGGAPVGRPVARWRRRSRCRSGSDPPSFDATVWLPYCGNHSVAIREGVS